MRDYSILIIKVVVSLKVPGAVVRSFFKVDFSLKVRLPLIVVLSGLLPSIVMMEDTGPLLKVRMAEPAVKIEAFILLGEQVIFRSALLHKSA